MSNAFGVWLACSVCLALYVVTTPFTSGVNENSRLSQALNVAKRGDFSATGWEACTHDLVVGVDGRKYSNKLPGPALLAVPLLYFLSVFSEIQSEFYGCVTPPYEIVTSATRKTVNLLLQVLPLCFAAFLLLRSLTQAGLSSGACQVFSVIFLMGNTAAILASVYMGHAFVAAFSALVVWACLEKRWVGTGLFLGVVCASDPGGPLLALPVALSVVQEHRASRYRVAIRVLTGFLPILLLVFLYNFAIFGSIFRSSVTFQPEEFKTPNLLFGMFSLVPELSVFSELLFGSQRGLFTSNPWLLSVALLVFLPLFIRVRNKHLRLWALTRALYGTLLVALILNATFNGWHGGLTPGPRYLALLLPVSALLPALIFDVASRPHRFLIWLLVALSVLLMVMLHQSTVLVPFTSLWSFAGTNSTLFGTLTRLGIVAAIFLLAGCAARGYQRK
jgi:hypothetical protein